MGISDLKWKAWTYLKARLKGAKYHRSVSALKGREHLKVLHYDINNWGDAVNIYMVEKLSGLPAISVDIDFRHTMYGSNGTSIGELNMVIGSILAHADGDTVVWGAGIQNDGLLLRSPPKRVCAVRGPLTAGVLRSQNIEVPEVFGDPVLLLPELYTPVVNPNPFKLGVVAHRNDANNPHIRALADEPGVKFISMRDSSMAVVDKIASCDAVVSTSLHGLIVADAYGIPSVWGRVGDTIPGGYFKYKDYYMSIGDPQESPDVFFNKPVSAQEVLSMARKRELQIDLDKLKKACPFLPQ